MKKTLIAALSFAAITAFATETINPVGLGVGFGGTSKAAATALSATKVGITTNATLRSGDASSSAFGGASTALGGSSSSSLGAGAGSSTVNSNYEQAAAGAYAPAGSAPRTSCRLFAGLGGTNTSGSFSGGIPIGNDQSCVTGTRIELMDKVNAQFGPTFTKNDYLEAICLVEGMDATKACIDYKASKPAVVQPTLGAGYAN